MLLYHPIWETTLTNPEIPEIFSIMMTEGRQTIMLMVEYNVTLCNGDCYTHSLLLMLYHIKHDFIRLLKLITCCFLKSHIRQ